MKIGNREVGSNAPPYIIAELSANHNGSLDRAVMLVDAAAEAGAHAIKLQTYTADTMTLDGAMPGFAIEGWNERWNGKTLYELYAEASTPWEWHAPLFERARARGLVAFSSPFDASAVEFLETLNAPAYKIASFENTDIPLIRRAARTGKPLIISTGMASRDELRESVAAAREHGCRDLVLLKCTSAYPAPPERANLRTLEDLRAAFDCEVGLSDHTPGIGAAIAAVALGASVIEKHFTLSRADGGVDADFSIEPDELRQLVVECERAWRALGEVAYGPAEEEKASLNYRRSLYVARDLRTGDTLTPDNVRCVRPGYGLAPKYLDAVMGRRVKRDAPRGTPLSWELLE